MTALSYEQVPAFRIQVSLFPSSPSPFPFLDSVLRRDDPRQRCAQRGLRELVARKSQRGIKFAPLNRVASNGRETRFYPYVNFSPRRLLSSRPSLLITYTRRLNIIRGVIREGRDVEMR